MKAKGNSQQLSLSLTEIPSSLGDVSIKIIKRRPVRSILEIRNLRFLLNFDKMNPS